jgi:hypothetical protein
MTGKWDNAATYNDNEDSGPANFMIWNASFTGKVQAPSRPVITASLGVKQNAYGVYAFDVAYTRTNTDATVVSISGSGSYNETTQVLTATLTNQAGLVANISYDDKKIKDRKLSGTITTAGNEKLADIYNVEGVAVVKYIDNYFESVI